MPKSSPPPSDYVVDDNPDGTYAVRYAEWLGGGLASFMDFDTVAEADAWIAGYEQGARENM